jgi:hypothetical protein
VAAPAIIKQKMRKSIKKKTLKSHWLSFQAPQQPKKPMTKISTPTATKRVAEDCNAQLSKPEGG